MGIYTKSIGFWSVKKENPTFGKEGIMISKGWHPSKLWSFGFVNKGIKLKNSNIDPGHPWISNNGKAFIFGDLICKKWVFMPSSIK